MNLRLKKKFIEKGYPQICELNLEGCLKTFALSWAHSKKSRFLIEDSDWMEAALSCCNCHQKAEAMSHEKMHALITEAIAKRLK